MTYEEVQNYLFDKLPMFQRIGPAAYKADLSNTLALCQYLNQPQQFLPCIHVAGTNGKGSSSHMLAAVLQRCGYKTGLYTSPHLLDYRERIKINGNCIEKDFITQFVSKHKNILEQLHLSFFEWTVGLAFSYFKEQAVDVAVIEVGLGGRLDSTNVINPLVSLITNISFDHQALLGSTLPQIATEKAGIIKPGIPVVISQSQTETNAVFIAKAQSCKSSWCMADQQYSCTVQDAGQEYQTVEVYNTSSQTKKQYTLDLTGHYQKYNLPGVLCVLDHLSRLGFNLPEQSVKEALKNVKSLTGLMGRWQIIKPKPYTVADTAHNLDGILQILMHIKSLKKQQVHMVFGVVRDKSIESILGILPNSFMYYFVCPELPRGLPAEELKALACSLHLEGEAYASVWEGYSAALSRATEADLIFIGGSTFVVADFLKHNTVLTPHS